MLNPRVLTVTLLLCFCLSTKVLAVPITWSTASGGNGHAYELIVDSQGITWPDARDAASLLGGYLVTITSVEENNFVFGTILNPDASQWGKHHGPWMGGYQDLTSASYSEPDSGWVWVTGEVWSYTNWSAPEPNEIVPGENYLHADATGAGTWNDLTIDGNQKGRVEWYIVEFARASTTPVPEPSTIAFALLSMCAIASRFKMRPLKQSGGINCKA